MLLINLIREKIHTNCKKKAKIKVIQQDHIKMEFIKLLYTELKE